MIPMADSITPANLPGTYPAYLGYVDGRWPTAPAVRAAHPSARLVTLTVKGAMPSSLAADGCDCEAGDLTVAAAIEWTAMKCATWPSVRPVIYANISTMVDVLAGLPSRSIPRARVRLLSAHYGVGEHICGPATCKYPGVTTAMDGTQWTDTAPGLHGSQIDLSTLNDDFFGTVATMDAIPLNICGSYTDGNGTLYVIGTDAQGVLHESKRTASGVWTAPYAIAGKVGA